GNSEQSSAPDGSDAAEREIRRGARIARQDRLASALPEEGERIVGEVDLCAHPADDRRFGERDREPASGGVVDEGASWSGAVETVDQLRLGGEVDGCGPARKLRIERL